MSSEAEDSRFVLRAETGTRERDAVSAVMVVWFITGTTEEMRVTKM